MNRRGFLGAITAVLAAAKVKGAVPESVPVHVYDADDFQWTDVPPVEISIVGIAMEAAAQPGDAICVTLDGRMVKMTVEEQTNIGDLMIMGIDGKLRPVRRCK